MNLGSDENLIKTEWQNYKDGYGSSAACVGGLIAQLLVNDASQREIVGELFDRLCHQGVLYEVSPVAIEPLVSIWLRLEAKSRQSSIAELVLAMSIGLDIELIDDRLTQIEFLRGLNSRGDLNSAWRIDCYKAVECSVPLQIEIMNASVDFRAELAYSIAWYPKYFHLSQKLFYCLIDKCQDLEWANCILNLGVLERFAGAKPTFEEKSRRMLESRDQLASAVSACYLRLHGSEDRDVVSVLEVVADDWDLFGCKFPDLQFYGGNLALFATNSLQAST